MKVKIDVTVIGVLETELVERLQRFICELLEAEFEVEVTLQGMSFGVNCQDEE